MKKNDDLRTPPWVYRPLGPFDLDPCAAPVFCQEGIAVENWPVTYKNGLTSEWNHSHFVWCNPPFSQKEKWIKKMIEHDNGILILPERGSAPWFGPLAKHCGQYFIMGKKINFLGGPSSNNLGSCLFPFGIEAINRIEQSGLPGMFVEVLSYTPRESR